MTASISKIRLYSSPVITIFSSSYALLTVKLCPFQDVLYSRFTGTSHRSFALIFLPMMIFAFCLFSLNVQNIVFLIFMFFFSEIPFYLHVSTPPRSNIILTKASKQRAVFQGIVFAYFFLEQGIKRRQMVWSRLSKNVKRGNFVTTGYYLVKFLCILFTDFF